MYRLLHQRLIRLFHCIFPQLDHSADDSIEPEQDPELTQYGLEFARTVMTKRPDILMSQPANILEFLFEFAIKVLHGNEPLPKAAAADFWVFILTQHRTYGLKC